MITIANLPLPEQARVHGDATRELTGASLDSRAVQPGELFAALPGANVHGATFAHGVVERGVSAILTDAAGWQTLIASGTDLRDVTVIETPEPRTVLGALSAAIQHTDAGRPRLLGVTGTNGKTTTTFILDALLQALGERTGLIGTIATVIDGEAVSSVRTTPESPDLHALLAQMRAAHVTWCAMEVSSHALAQHRVDGAHFSVAGFTNLSQDHLDFHPTMEDYFEAKALLFTPQFSDSGVVVLADDWARRLARTAGVPITTISRNPADAPSFLVRDEADGHFTLIDSTGSLKPLKARSPLPGDFNVMNTALALVMLLNAGFDAHDLGRVAGDFTVAVPGRMEVVSEAAPRAIVDYSHTPDALENVLGGLTGEPLVVVVGAGGDRDGSKRRLMGQAVARLADVVIVTDDNPRSEDPSAIRAQVLAGVAEARAGGVARVGEHTVFEIASRHDAIACGVRLAGATGTLLVAGKGHETGQDVGGTVHPFDDRVQTREAIAAGNSAAQTGRVQD